MTGCCGLDAKVFGGPRRDGESEPIRVGLDQSPLFNELNRRTPCAPICEMAFEFGAPLVKAMKMKAQTRRQSWRNPRRFSRATWDNISEPYGEWSAMPHLSGQSMNFVGKVPHSIIHFVLVPLHPLERPLQYPVVTTTLYARISIVV